MKKRIFQFNFLFVCQSRYVTDISFTLTLNDNLTKRQQKRKNNSYKKGNYDINM